MAFTFDQFQIDAFAEQWLESLDGPDATVKGLLEKTHGSYNLGAHFMMSDIATAAMRSQATEGELILYSCLAAFQIARFPGRADRWTSARDHLESAFAFAQRSGRAEIARSLLTRVVAESKQAGWGPRGGSNDSDPAELAAHDRDMASITERDVRAAALLDPTVSLDQLLLEQ